MRDIGAKQGRTFDDIDAARRWLVDHDECTGSIGVVGFCMGASYAVLLAPDHGYAAASVNYGSLPKDALGYLANACPMVGSFGAKDRSPARRRAHQTPVARSVLGARLGRRVRLLASATSADVPRFETVGASE